MHGDRAAVRRINTLCVPHVKLHHCNHEHFRHRSLPLSLITSAAAGCQITQASSPPAARPATSGLHNRSTSSQPQTPPPQPPQIPHNPTRCSSRQSKKTTSFDIIMTKLKGFDLSARSGLAVESIATWMSDTITHNPKLTLFVNIYMSSGFLLGQLHSIFVILQFS